VDHIIGAVSLEAVGTFDTVVAVVILFGCSADVIACDVA
jgi:hypothetical protein